MEYLNRDYLKKKNTIKYQEWKNWTQVDDSSFLLKASFWLGLPVISSIKSCASHLILSMLRAFKKLQMEVSKLIMNPPFPVHNNTYKVFNYLL